MPAATQTEIRYAQAGDAPRDAVVTPMRFFYDEKNGGDFVLCFYDHTQKKYLQLPSKSITRARSVR